MIDSFVILSRELTFLIKYQRRRGTKDLFSVIIGQILRTKALRMTSVRNRALPKISN